MLFVKPHLSAYSYPIVHFQHIKNTKTDDQIKKKVYCNKMFIVNRWNAFFTVNFV